MLGHRSRSCLSPSVGNSTLILGHYTLWQSASPNYKYIPILCVWVYNVCGIYCCIMQQSNVRAVYIMILYHRASRKTSTMYYSVPQCTENLGTGSVGRKSWGSHRRWKVHTFFLFMCLYFEMESKKWATPALLLYSSIRCYMIYVWYIYIMDIIIIMYINIILPPTSYQVTAVVGLC